MIAFVILATICTGMVAAVSVACLTECPDWAIAVIYVAVCAGMCAALNIWLRREVKKSTDFYKKLFSEWKHLALESLGNEGQLWLDLKAADIDCNYCKHAKDEEITRKCIEQDCDCDKCGIDCPCKHCVDKSEWVWTGVQKNA